MCSTGRIICYAILMQFDEKLFSFQASNQEFFSHFVAEDFSTYVDRKRQEYVHGNHIEMQAMSEIYNRTIQLYCYSTGMYFFHLYCKVSLVAFALIIESFFL